MRVVSRRKQRERPQEDAAILQRTMNRLRGYALIPRGVYRFATHDEADEWMTETIASTHELRNSKTSSSSAVVPVASKELLLRMKQTVRPSDATDVAFLRRRLAAEEE